jgi:crotonobetainyl-CoA:carnitine CoA-transferase CaiB-like acyl-CoA transferase
MVPFQAFAARDGWIYVAVWVERLWAPFCEAIGMPSLAADPRFRTREDRRRARKELVVLLEPKFRERTVREWVAALEARDVLCAPVNSYRDFPGDAQIQASGMLVDEDHPRAGRLRTLATPIAFSATPGSIRSHAPALGEHTDEVRQEFASLAAASTPA